MSLYEAFGVVILSAAGLAFAIWYLSCWCDMVGCWSRGHGYFSMAYPESGIFAVVNTAMVICTAAFSLYWLTN